MSRRARPTPRRGGARTLRRLRRPARDARDHEDGRDRRHGARAQLEEATGSRGRRRESRPRPVAAGVPAGRQPRPDLRPARHGPRPRRADAGGAQGAARRRGRLPRRSAATSIPDDVPIIGGLDDLVVVVLAVDLFLDGVPDDLLHEKLDELGIDRAAFERDIAQIRRLTPGPVRRTIRRVPGLDRPAGDAIEATRSRAARAGLDHQGGSASREGHPDQGRGEARQERRDEDRRRRLRHELPHPAAAGRARPPAAPTAPGSTTSRAARTSASASARKPRSPRPASPARR